MNLNTEFQSFNEAIKLTQSRKYKILNSRNAVREKIRSYFKNELQINQPQFMWQGSFSINTVLNPLANDEVDIDDGLYLKHINQNDEETWPSPKEAHQLVMDALCNHTQDGCEDKTSCVRVIYRNFYHVDIPIYIMQGNHAKLANIKTNKWETSDSKDFRDWFYKTRKNEQTNRIIRYLKAWRDYNNIDFSSIELTILVTENHIGNDDDGMALKSTVDNIYSHLVRYRKIDKPVAPYENLLEGKDINWQKTGKDLNGDRTHGAKGIFESLREYLSCNIPDEELLILLCWSSKTKKFKRCVPLLSVFFLQQILI